MLSNNDFKGYSFELTIQNTLTNNGYLFTGNPKDVCLWKSNTGKGVDITIPEYSIEIECKYVSKPVWKASSLNKHYIKRFSLSKYRFVVVNDLTMYSCSIREYLLKSGIHLVNPFYLIQHLNQIRFKYYKGYSRYIKRLITLFSYIMDYSSYIIDYSMCSDDLMCKLLLFYDCLEQLEELELEKYRKLGMVEYRPDRCEHRGECLDVMFNEEIEGWID